VHRRRRHAAGELRLQLLGHALDSVLERVDLAGQLLGAAQGVIGDGLDHLGQAGVDLLQLLGQDQVRLAYGAQLAAQAGEVEAADHEQVNDAEHAHAGDERRHARTPSAPAAPDAEREDERQAEKRGADQNLSESPHSTPASTNRRDYPTRAIMVSIVLTPHVRRGLLRRIDRRPSD